MTYLKLKILTLSVLCFTLLTSSFEKAQMNWKAKWISTDLHGKFPKLPAWQQLEVN